MRVYFNSLLPVGEGPGMRVYFYALSQRERGTPFSPWEKGRG